MQGILRVNAELLASEGLDPEWPAFEQKADDSGH
jgi:hypothetical protein